MNPQEVRRRLWAKLGEIKPKQRKEGEAPLPSSRAMDSLSTPEGEDDSSTEPATPT